MSCCTEEGFLALWHPQVRDLQVAEVRIWGGEIGYWFRLLPLMLLVKYSSYKAVLFPSTPCLLDVAGWCILIKMSQGGENKEETKRISYLRFLGDT